jgi:Transposase DDE domain
VDLDTLIVAVYCLVDDLVDEVMLSGATEKLRQRGPKPILDDREVLSIEIVGELADYGREQTEGGFFYGVRAHLLVAWAGVIVRAALAPASVHDLHLGERLAEGMGRGWVLADRNYWSPLLAEQFHTHQEGPRLVARYKVAKKEREKGLAWPPWLVHKRRRIETVISQ